MNKKIIIREFSEYPNCTGVWKLEKEITVRNPELIEKIMKNIK